MANTAINRPKNMHTFLVIWIGQVISILGSGLTSFALGVWIFDQTGKATPFALTALFAVLPGVLLAPVAGALADRLNRRRIMILADTGNALVTLSAATLLFVGDLQVWHIYLIAFAGSIFGAFQEPAYTASVTMLVPKEELARAGGMMQIGQALSTLLTPIAAGALYGLIGLRGIILIDVVTYLFAIAALIFVNIPQPAPPIQDGEPAEKKSLWSDVAFGWRYLRARTGLFGLLWYFALVNFFLNFSGVLSGPLVLSFASPSALGVVQMVAGAAMLIGSMLMSAWGGPKRRVVWLIAFIALASTGLFVEGLRPSTFTIAAGNFILLFFIPFAASLSQAIFQTKVSPDVQGRVFAIRGMIARSMTPIAFLLSGPIADQIFEPLLLEGGALSGTFIAAWIGVGPGRGIGLLFIISCLLLWAASLGAYANPRIRLVEDELPDALPEAAIEPEEAVESGGLASATPGD